MIGQKGIPARFGGVERHVHDLSVRLAKQDHNVTVYGRSWYTDAHNMVVQGVKSKILPSVHTKHLDTITHTFLATIHAMYTGYDVIHYHGVGPSLLSWMPRLFTPHIKVVSTFHSIDRKHQKWNILARAVLKVGEKAACTFAHNTIAVSHTIAQYARDVYDRDADYIPNGVNELKKTKKTKHIQNWGLKPNEYILMVSRLIPHKGAHYLIAAFTHLQKKYPKTLGKKKLVIVGDGYYTEEYVHKLKDMAEENQKIVFTGFQTGDALQEFFSHASFMVHPSDQEGLPINVLEAMSYGVPLVLSDIPEHRELIHNPDYLFAHGNARSLANTIKRMLANDKKTLTAQASAYKETIKTYYHWKKIVKDIIAIYEEPIATPLHERRILPATK